MKNPIIPLNTEWNRKCKILPGKGKGNLHKIKDGIAYFTWEESDSEEVKLYCEEGVFLNNFQIEKIAGDNDEVIKTDPEISYKRYPFALFK